MTDDLSSILRRVSAGELSPEEALPLIDGRTGRKDRFAQPPPQVAYPQDDVPGPPGVAGSAQDRQSPQDTVRADSVRVLGAYRSIDVVSDPNVVEAFVSGHHSARREGTTLVITAPDIPPEAAVEGDRNGPFSFSSLPRGLAWVRALRDQHLVVRVHPRLHLELDVSGTKVRVARCAAGARLRVIACSLELEEVAGRLDVNATASSVTGSIAPADSSRLSCECSSARLTVPPEADLRIRARNRMSKVVLPGGRSAPGGLEPEFSEAVLGSGRDHLEVEALMSSVVVATRS